MPTSAQAARNDRTLNELLVLLDAIRAGRAREREFAIKVLKERLSRMANRAPPRLFILELAAERLGPLLSDVVFIGSCATGLLLTDNAETPIRRVRCDYRYL